ncbi:MAG: CBS domain-containing protein [Candidatus Contubernalis sp.]|nr:CBS domain-containing protein [Candidatus Contubernalis sp.]
MDISAADIMCTEVISIAPEASLEETVKILAKNHVSGLPVVDQDNKVVGIISERNVIDFSSKLNVVALVGFSGWVSPQADVSFEAFSRTKVEDLMSRKVVTAKSGTSGEEIARLMKNRKINRIPIVDENGKLIGIVTRGDLVNYLAAKN